MLCCYNESCQVSPVRNWLFGNHHVVVLITLEWITLFVLIYTCRPVSQREVTINVQSKGSTCSKCLVSNMQSSLSSQKFILCPIIFHFEYHISILVAKWLGGRLETFHSSLLLLFCMLHSPNSLTNHLIYGPL